MVKKFILSSLLFTACVVQAETLGSNLFGLLPVTSSSQRTLVAVPWCECAAADNQAISVANLIKTANLTAGDTLTALSSTGEALNTWELVEDSGTGVKTWDSVSQVSANNQVSQTPNASSETVVRGSAIILVRKEKPSSAFTFYLYGQVPTAAATSTAIAGSADTPAYTLMAAPSTSAQGLNQSGQWSGTINASDTIAIPGEDGLNVTLSYSDGKWGNPVPPQLQSTLGSFKVYTKTIPVGTGFWYVSRGGSPTITWTDVPTK